MSQKTSKTGLRGAVVVVAGTAAIVVVAGTLWLLVVGLPYHSETYVLRNEHPTAGDTRIAFAVDPRGVNRWHTRHGGPWQISFFAESAQGPSNVVVAELSVAATSHGLPDRHLIEISGPMRLSTSRAGGGSFVVSAELGPTFEATCSAQPTLVVRATLRLSSARHDTEHDVVVQFDCVEERGWIRYNPLLDVT